MKHALDTLLARQNLSRQASADLLEALASGNADPAVAGAILAALRMKGETPDELAGFAQAMRRLARLPALADGPPLLDIVGTGGDGSSSYNISTGSALLAAACGLRIAKHGNRSISSTCGSADVLEALGLPQPLNEADAAACLERTGFTFFFAPHYHPAMAAIAPVRRALATRTIFNMLGPLTNPARPPFGVIGAFSLDAARTMAGALAALDIQRYFVINSTDGARTWDEPTPIGPFTLLDVRPGLVDETTRDPRSWDLPRCRPEDLQGGDAAHNALALREALSGRPGPLHHTLILGAALALEVAGAVTTPIEAATSAAAAINDGRAAQLLRNLNTFGDELRARTPVGKEPPRA